MATPFGYTPQVYNAKDLIYQNGKVYYQPKASIMGGEPVAYGSPVEIRNWDLIQREVPGIFGGMENPNISGKYAWEYQNLADFMPKTQVQSMWGEPTYADVQGANPYYQQGGGLTPDQRMQWFLSDPARMNLLFGAYGTLVNPYSGNYEGSGYFNDDMVSLNPYEYSGQIYNNDTGRGERNQYAAQNAQYVLGTLRQFFPNKTDAELAKAATDAMWDTSNQRWREGRAGQAWYYAGNPNDYVRQIASKMGGLQPQQEALLAATDTKMATQGAGYRSAAHAADDAATQKRFMEGLASAGLLVGGAYGLSNLLNTGLSGLLGGTTGATTGATAGSGATGLDSIIGAIEAGGNTVTPGFGAITGGSSGAGYVGNLVGAGLPVDVGTGLLTGGAGSVLPNIIIPNTTVPEPPTTTPTTPSTPPTQTPTTPPTPTATTPPTTTATTPTTTAGGSGMSTSDFANLFDDFVIDDKIQVLTNMGVPESIATSIAPTLSGNALQSLINLSGMTGASSLGNMLSGLFGGGQPQSGSSGMDLSRIIQSVLTGAGGLLSGNAAQQAQSDYAKSLENIAKINQFRPVGVTTRFGSSQFTTDPTTGQVTTAGYNVAPDLKTIQDRQMGMLPGLQTQYENVSKLGQGYLKATPEQQAADWMAKQQNVLSASRATDLANLRNRMVQEGRSGLGIGGDAGMMAANPELAAYYNSIQQQNRELAAQADEYGKKNALFGLDLQSQAYKPLQTALGGASYIEGLGQQPMDLGINIGAKGQAANQPSMELLAKSAQAMTPANAYSPWGAALQGAGGMLQNYTQQQQQQSFIKDMFGNLFAGMGK